MFITGQVNIHEQKGNRKVRQLGFQETNIVDMAKPITKECFKVETPEQLAPMLAAAYKLTMSDRPGPVLLDIPMNIQSALIDYVPIEYISAERTIPSKLNLNILFNALQKAKRPLIIAGNGINCCSSATTVSRVY